MPNHHHFVIRLIGGTVLADKSPEIHVGDTVTYTSPDGKARVEFPDSTPYSVREIHNAHDHLVRSPGLFEFHCFITPHGQTKEVGWSEEHPEAGGEHDVKPGLTDPPPPDPTT